MKVLFNDNAKANTEIRKSNIAVLKENNFIEGGLNSRSGELYLCEMKTKCILIFGTRCNVAGKRNKYFSLSKDFGSLKDAVDFFNVLRLSLTQTVTASLNS